MAGTQDMPKTVFKHGFEGLREFLKASGRRFQPKQVGHFELHEGSFSVTATKSVYLLAERV